MQPNDLPIVCLLLELSDEAAAVRVDFLHELTEPLEPHYCGRLLRITLTVRRRSRTQCAKDASALSALPLCPLCEAYLPYSVRSPRTTVVPITSLWFIPG